jgi:hypothetical protein
VGTNVAYKLQSELAVCQGAGGLALIDLCSWLVESCQLIRWALGLALQRLCGRLLPRRCQFETPTGIRGGDAAPGGRRYR